MDISIAVAGASALVPVLLMGAAALVAQAARVRSQTLARAFSLGSGLAVLALVLALVAPLWLGAEARRLPAGLQASTFSLVMALLVQVLGWVIGAFSARYLEGEHGQTRYGAALAGVLASVHLLLLANHWLVLIAAWALVGLALQPLLCFYAERPFARLAAYKKRLADRAADLLLLVAAGLAWLEVGSGSLSDLWSHLATQGASLGLQASAVLLVLAVVLRSALLPVHGWLIQVMEAPTPVSALLHAGVVNLGGFVLIRFAPLLEQAPAARGLLVALGLATAVLAGVVMLTRISIKVRLAWSTVAQMGFMLLECGLGLYTLAALHLLGHSLYKAHAFLSASTVVRQSRLQRLLGPVAVRPLSLLLAPGLGVAGVMALQQALAPAAWPLWWSAVLGLAWAPLLWLPQTVSSQAARMRQLAVGLAMVCGLTLAAVLGHALPLGLQDAPDDRLGLLVLTGMALLYLGMALLQRRPQALQGARRWSYAGFYLDEIYTRVALRLGGSAWAPAPSELALWTASRPLATDARA